MKKRTLALLLCGISYCAHAVQDHLRENPDVKADWYQLKTLRVDNDTQDTHIRVQLMSGDLVASEYWLKGGQESGTRKSNVSALGQITSVRVRALKGEAKGQQAEYAIDSELESRSRVTIDVFLRNGELAMSRQKRDSYRKDIKFEEQEKKREENAQTQRMERIQSQEADEAEIEAVDL